MEIVWKSSCGSADDVALTRAPWTPLANTDSLAAGSPGAQRLTLARRWIPGPGAEEGLLGCVLRFSNAGSVVPTCRERFRDTR